MKTKIKRHSRSVLSVILAISMLISTMMVGLIASDAAQANSESVGDYGTTTYYYRGGYGDHWNSGAAMTHLVEAYYYYEVSGNNSFKISDVQTGWDSGNFYDGTKIDGDNGIKNLSNDTSNNNNISDTNSGTHYIIFDEKNTKVWATSTLPEIYTIYIRDDANWGYNNIKLYTFTDDTLTTPANGNTLGSWSGTSLKHLLGVESLTHDEATVYKLTGSVIPTAGIILNNGGSSQTGNMTLANNHLYTTGTGDRDQGVYNPLTTPTFTVNGGSTATVNGGDTVTVNITNWESVQPDANHELKLYKGSTFVQNLTTQSSTVTITGTDTTIKEDLTYTVKSEPTTAGAATYSKSVNNNTATITVYYPVYSLIGNLDNTYLASVNGDTPDGSCGWDMGYVNKYAVNSATDTPGVYTITVNTLTAEQINAQHSSGTVNVALYKKGTGKYRFYLHSTTTYYNEYGKDYTVPNSGVTAAMGLYVQTQASGKDEGGSIVLPANKGCTITIDEREASPVGSGVNPNGQITIDIVSIDYHGHYSLTGNVTDKYIVGSTLVKPSGIDENDWWSHYWEETAIDTPVPGETDKYYITFTTTNYTKDNDTYCANIGFAGENNVQYAFIKGDTAYNTYGVDLEIPGSITDSNNLFVYTKDSGGSLKLKPNTTYTITVDESQRKATGQPYGKITIDATTVYANAINMVRPFDVTNRRPSDLEQSNAGGTLTVTCGQDSASTSGTTTVATVTHAKPMTATYAASAANSGYTFAGWYSDEDCTTKVSDDLSYTPDEFSVTKTLYALYTEDAPSTSYDVTVTKSGKGDGTISVTGAAVSTESGNTVTYTAYAGATVVVTATPASSPLSVVGSITGDGTVSGNKATIENIAANKALNVTFTKKTSYTVTLKGTNGQIKAQAYQSDKTTTSGSEVTVNSGSTGTIEVPIGGYLKLTAGDADSGKEFSNFKLETGKYKRTSDQSTGSSPMMIRPIADMTAEAVFNDGGESSSWSVDFNDTDTDASLKKITGLKVDNFNSDTNKDVYYTQFTIPKGTNYFHVWDGSNDFRFTGDTAYTVTLNNNYSPCTTAWNPDAKQDGKITVASATTVYIYAMYNNVDGNNAANKEMKLLFSTTKRHGGTSSDISTEGYQRIYAMDGTLGSTADYGDTVITMGNGLLESDIEDASGNSELYVKSYDNHNVYYFDPDQNISFRVQTTVASAQTKLGVRGFVYNGKSVDAIDDGNGVYYADITVKANSVVDINGGTTHDPILEVIPVYFNTTVPQEKNNNEFITFYVDATTIDNRFGYNIGYFIWYQNSAGNEVQGSYPGQPLLRTGTKYVGYIPKHYVANDATYNTNTATFAGVLLNNLHENSSVHDECLESWGCDKVNYQTFDYEDPYVISQDPLVDTIEYVVKYEKTNDNLQTGTHWYNSTYNKAGDLNGKTSGYAFPSDISAPNSANQLNGFELLRDFDNNPVDVYGNKITENFSNSVFIISVGNQNVAPSNDWDTVWMIYDGSTKSFILGSNPASFIGVETANENVNLSGKTVYINYEKFLDGSEHPQTYSHSGDTGNSGDRIDGRWLYTKSTDHTNGRIRVATLGKNNDTLNFLTYANGGSNARIAYYDNTVNGLEQVNANNTHSPSTQDDNYGRWTTFDNRTTVAKAVLNEPTGYKIKGFYTLKTGISGNDNGFSSSISDYDEMVRESATVAKYTNSRDTWIVAVVEPVPASNLYLKHEMYGGEGAHSGAGDFYIKADVVNSNGTVVATSGDFVDGYDGYEFEYLNSVVQKGQNYKVKVTLRTVMAGTNTFCAWYPTVLATNDYGTPKSTNSSGVDVFGLGGTQETVYEVPVDDLYGSNTDGTFEYTNLAYYSDIDMGGAVHVTHSLKDGSVGSGTTYASVKVLNGGNEVATFNTNYSATGTITVPSQYTKRTSGNTIEITLRTVPDEYSTFNKFWESDGKTEITGAFVDSTTRIATKTLATIDVADLYKDTGTEQNPKYEFDTTKSSYQYYSDLTKLEYRYVIEYQYKSRIWETQSYKVPAASDDEAFTVEEFNKYIQTAQVTDADTKQTVDGIEFRSDALKKEFLTSKAPYEDNFRETITWDFTGATVSYYDSGKQLSIKVTTTSKDDDPLNLVVHFPFECNVQTTGLDVTRDGEGKVQYVEGKTEFSARPLYMQRYTVNNMYDLTSEIYLQAPESVWKNGVEKFFSYWSLKDQKTGREYAKCYSRNLNYAFYQDTVVDLAYENTSALSPSDNADKGTSARIEFLENTRNQWNSNPGTSSWNPADRVISDFVLYYNYLGKQINTIQNMKAGLVFETVGNLDTDEHGEYVTNRFTYASKHASDNLTTLKDDVISFIGQNESSNEKYLKSEFNTYRDTTRPAETINKNNGLDNKNEIEYYYTMAANGTKERELKYYRVYSYLKDANGNVVAVSDPIYLTIYDIASIQNGSAKMPGV